MNQVLWYSVQYLGLCAIALLVSLLLLVALDLICAVGSKPRPSDQVRATMTLSGLSGLRSLDEMQRWRFSPPVPESSPDELERLKQLCDGIDGVDCTVDAEGCIVDRNRPAGE